MGEPQSARVPVIVLTGYLGAGKTTLLKEALRQPAFANSALIVNEIGEVGIDHLLLGGEPVLLDGGCICCQLTNDIAHTLRDLDERKRQGLIPAFHRVIIETTGLANPGPILQRLATDAWIARRFRVQSVIAVADTVNLAATLAVSPEVAVQIAVSDRVVLSKADLAEETARDSAIDLLRGLNPAVPITPAVRGQIDPDILLRDTKRTSFLSVRDWDGRDHLSRLSTKSVQIDTPRLRWHRAAAVLDGIATRHGAALLRIKGILSIVESDLPVIIQAVQGVFQPPETLPGWDGHTPRSQIVLIGRDLDLSAIATSMRDALADPIATSSRLETA